MQDTIDIPMVRSGRDSLIAMSCLWLLFVATVGLRIYGRMRGPGLSLDDVFAGTAMVSSKLIQPCEVSVDMMKGLGNKYNRLECYR